LVMFVGIIKSILFKNTNIEKCDCNIGDLRSQHGLSVAWEIQKVSVQLAEKIVNKAKNGNWFSCVRKIIPEV